MLSGRILKQANPQQLLNQYRCQSLELVFLALCQNQRKHNTNNNKINNNEYNEYESDGDRKFNYNIIEENLNDNEMSIENTNVNSNYVNNKSFDLSRVKANIMKNYILTKRRPLFLFIFYVIPFIALISMKFSIGQKPKHIPVAVYNEDNQRFSKLFLHSIDSKYLRPEIFAENQTAFDSVVDGKNTISIVFTKNFSKTFELRITDVFEMTDNELDSSAVKIYADFSDSIVGNLVYNQLLKAFENFVRGLGPEYGQNLYRYFFPITFENAIYGHVDLNLNAYISPGIMFALMHTLPMVISAFQVVYDRRNTSLERVLVAGVKPIEFFTAHIIQNIIMITILVFASMLIAFGFFQNEQLGSYAQVFALFFIQAIQGMSIGFLMALILSDQISVGVSTQYYR